MSSQFEQFCQTIASLRGPDGCPWDREQTYKSLTRYLLEETYEVLDAINTNDFAKLQEELGDLLLQIVLQAQLSSEEKHFNIQDVIQTINTKMIARHPHIFSDKKLKTSTEVLAQWEQIKEAERSSDIAGKRNNNKPESALSNIPPGLPALLKALKISEKAVNKGFEWEKEEDIWKQLDREIEEFKQEVEKADDDKSANEPLPRGSSINGEDLYLELGDILFTIVNIARWYRIDPEEALLLTIEKFKARFEFMEKKADRPLQKLNPSQWENLWKQAKEDIIASKHV